MIRLSRKGDRTSSECAMLARSTLTRMSPGRWLRNSRAMWPPGTPRSGSTSARFQRRGPSIDGPLRWKRALVEPERGVPGGHMAREFRSHLPGDILVKVDRASMAHSLEVRSPFLDSRIIEFAFAQVPNALRASDAQRK